MNNIEIKINYHLNKYPAIKKIIKRIYQTCMYIISPKIKSEGNIKRISPNDGMEYFFGYYDKSPWDITDRFMLCLRVEETYKSVAPNKTADIILIDTQNDNSYEIIAQTNSWNVQQGCMLQWLGPDFSTKIIYNDFRNGKYCSIILDIKTKKEKVIEMPIYSVSHDGRFALTLDFSRLHRLRKGYGYSNIPESTSKEKCPDKPCIWYVDLKSYEIKPLLKYTDFANFETKHEMINAEHKVNHIMINPSGDRCMVLHRWFNGSRKYTRLVTVNIDGTEMYNLSDDDMVSHCCWKNDVEILAYGRKKNLGNGYYLMKDRTNKFKRIWNEISSDGHPSYSPDGKLIVTDTYPDRARMGTIYLSDGFKVNKLARVFAPFKYDNDVRCDLHPRWSNFSDKICIDSVFEGRRALYVINLRN